MKPFSARRGIGTFATAHSQRFRERSCHATRQVNREVVVPNTEAGFTTLPELVATAHTVVLGTIASEHRGAVDDQGDVRITQRLLHVRVERTLAGRRPGPGVVISTKGWQQIDGQPETRLRMEDYPRIDVGNRVVLFLVWGCPALTDRADGSVRLPA
jgi:hypothetical protein